MPRWIPPGCSRVSWGRLLGVLGLSLIAIGAPCAAEGTANGSTEGISNVTLSRTPAASVVILVPAPKLAWPAHGSAAVAVAGLGTLGSVGGNTPKPIASMAKIMTAYLTLLEYPLSLGQTGFTYRVTRDDALDMHRRVVLDQSTLAVRAGEQLNEYQLLEGLLIPSGNNVAAILARHDANGRLGAFVTKMSSEAKALGLIHTTYTDPSGYEPTTVSTALDQLRLAQVVMTNPVFAQIVAKASIGLPVAGTVRNNNSIVGRDGFVGIKTGSDGQAGGCLAFAVRRLVAGRGPNARLAAPRLVTIYGVVMGQGRSTEGSVLQAALRSAQTLASSVASNLEVRVVVPPTTVVLVAASAHRARVTAVSPASLSRLGVGWPLRRLS